MHLPWKSGRSPARPPFSFLISSPLARELAPKNRHFEKHAFPWPGEGGCLLPPHYSVESRPSQILPLILPRQERSRWRNTLGGEAPQPSARRTGTAAAPRQPRDRAGSRTPTPGMGMLGGRRGADPPVGPGRAGAAVPVAPGHRPDGAGGRSHRASAAIAPARPPADTRRRPGWAWVSAAAALEGAPSLRPS